MCEGQDRRLPAPVHRRGGDDRRRHPGAQRERLPHCRPTGSTARRSRGDSPNAVMAELFGREGGVSKGRGGSMPSSTGSGASSAATASSAAACRCPPASRSPAITSRPRTRSLDDGRRRHQPGHLRRDDEPGGAVEAAGRLPHHQQPVLEPGTALQALRCDRPVAQVRGLRRARHALRRHGRP